MQLAIQCQQDGERSSARRTKRRERAQVSEGKTVRVGEEEEEEETDKGHLRASASSVAAAVCASAAANPSRTASAFSSAASCKVATS